MNQRRKRDDEDAMEAPSAEPQEAPGPDVTFQPESGVPVPDERISADKRPLKDEE
jgi:hypothetical protein